MLTFPSMVRAALAVTVALVAALMVAASASAGFGIKAFDGQATANQAGDAYTQAGGHPYEATTWIDFNTAGTTSFGQPLADGNVKDVTVDLPAGFVGDPRVGPKCTADQLEENVCPPNTQVGLLSITVPLFFGTGTVSNGIHNMVPRDGVLADFGVNALGVVVHLIPKVRPDGTFGLSVDSPNTPQTLALSRVKAAFWGVPADPGHDRVRILGPAVCFELFPGFTVCPDGHGNQPSDQPPRPFVSLPTDCSAGPLEATVRANSWQDPDRFVSRSFTSHLPPAYPADPADWGPVQGVTGCDQLPEFDPAVEVSAGSSKPDAPTGLSFGLSFPADPGLEDPDVPTRSPLKNAVVRLPEGMSINPSAAAGLEACSDSQLGLGSDDAIQCPAGSKIGTVTATSPLLQRLSNVSGEAMENENGDVLLEEVEGGVYIRSQNSTDPGSGEMFRLALVLKNDKRGLLIKLPGQVRADAKTGRLVATFANNPQLPVSDIQVDLKGGERAPLALPEDCGSHTVEVELSSWAGQSVSLSDSIEVACPSADGFAPGFVAGATSPVGGGFSPLVAWIDRPQGQRFISDVQVDLPEGLLAKLRGVEHCPDSLASDGTPGVCPAGSLIGSATVAAGSGTAPFVLGASVYLTGPYQGAPYGLSVQVPAKAGPFDLGMVKVRQKILVDPETARVSIDSDPLPQIVGGVPVRLRTVDIDVDRAGFAINPTSCRTKQIQATLTSSTGQVHKTSQRFQAGGCHQLGFNPRLAMRATGPKQTRTGGHPGLTTTLTQQQGQANIAKAKVTLPRSIVLDPLNTIDPKMICDYDKSLKADCPQSTVIGKATAVTPVLNKPLSGQVHMVQGIKFGPKGNRIRTTPSLLVKLRGEVAINLRGQTTVNNKTSRLVTTFAAVPDAPVSKFTLKITGGKKGILVVTRTRRAKINLCTNKQTANIETDGHNSKTADYPTTVKAPCAQQARRPARKALRAKR